jgi:DNA-nicking Smr family endonuclease
MDDEELFRELMRSLGVEPVTGGERRRPPARKPAAAPAGRARPRSKSRPPADDEDALFISSMDSLEVVPDKDRREPRRRVPGMRKLRASRIGDALPEASLDLHGQSAEEALRSLERFMAEAAAQRLRTVIVVTGKGLRSDGGVSVLKQVFEQWLREKGPRRVRAFSEAPRALGGRGAYVLFLR